MFLKNMKIGAQIGLGGGLILAMTLLIGVIGLVHMARIQAHLEDIARDGVAKLKLVGAMRDAVNTGAISVRNLVLLTDETDMAQETQRIREQKQIYDATSEKLGALMSSETEKALYAEVAEARSRTEPLIVKAMDFALGNPIAATQVLVNEARPAQTRWLQALNALIELEARTSEQTVKDAESDYEAAQLLMVIMAGMALVVGGGIGWLVLGSLTSRIGQAAKVAQTVASGDLTSHIEVDSRDEVGDLNDALKKMNASLAGIVNQVRNGTETISVASREIASGNADLSKRTESQAAALEETASSMEELTSTVRQNADNAQRANELVSATAEIAVRGRRIVGDVAATMASIKASSQRIADITGIIDSIAFQTNILALNAAVEAARAGEEGRGFAVVASEVRNLAQRSAAAAREIKALIGDSTTRVDAGDTLARQAGHTMDEIGASVTRVTGIMAEIAAASAEQRAGIEQINEAIIQMDAVTQQNAALVEEAAAATSSLQSQASRLVEAVGVFRVAGASQAAHSLGPVAEATVRPLSKRRASLRLVVPRRRSA
ncbi:MAG: MCP four helix bundle domain-containing protein [Thiobacillus sp.]|nr:MCP four helix bundle domain-containing protein [Thiobacillus sp.]